jgi:hypothetical protein
MTQADRILKHLKRGKPITGLDAFKKFGCLRLPARIAELKREHDIRSRTVEKGGKYVKEYRLA